MPIVVEWILLLAGVLALPVPILAVVMCTSLEPQPLFRRLAASRVLRHWVAVLVVTCSAVVGAWVSAAVYAKYHVSAVVTPSQSRAAH
jgi:hypothetical protein